MIPAETQNNGISRASTRTKVVVATTVMLSFISFWRAAAIVLSDLASSAYYAGGIAETQIGKSAPWFILAVMLFSYAVRAIYVESCSMFVRGGVYKVVHEAMGGTLAKISVSALMFDYILTGPISGVSAGLYLAGIVNEMGERFHIPSLHFYPPWFAAAFAVLATLYFWRKNILGMHESSEKALRIMQITTVMVVILIGWCLLTMGMKGFQPVPLPIKANLKLGPDSVGWLKGTIAPTITAVAILIGLGHSLLAMSGFETLAQVYRELASPKLQNLKRAGNVIFLYSMLFTSLASFFAVMLIPDSERPKYLNNLLGGLSMFLVGPAALKMLFHIFVVVVGTLILAGAVNTAIIGSNGVLNRVAEDGVLPNWFRKPHTRFGTTSRLINTVVILQIVTIVLSRRRRQSARRSLRVRRGVELFVQRTFRARAAVQAAGKSRVESADERPHGQCRNSDRPGPDHAVSFHARLYQRLHQGTGDHRRCGFHADLFPGVYGFGKDQPEGKGSQPPGPGTIPA